MMRILGIETSCDDTSVAVVEDGHHILSNVIASQDRSHAPFGGIVPEIAARKHVEALGYTVERALEQAQSSYSDIDAIGVTAQHGLLRSIVVGVAAAKTLAFSLDIPLIGVHHIEGHIFSNVLHHGTGISYPHLCLTVSGGHTLLLLVHALGDYELLGRTQDDAAGEVFDKISKYLGLGFPGGPIVDRLAQTGDPTRYKFPRPMLNNEGYNFSFSGLKTAVIREIEAIKATGKPFEIADVVASFQAAVVDVLVGKTLRAARHYNISHITICGGVSANSGLRSAFDRIRTESPAMHIYYPPLALCTDNAAMIAGLAYYKWKQGAVSSQWLDAAANAPLGLRQANYKK